jgi:cytochrome oxidase Cu insertion factor (SCO1/SenC/PrrC family)
MNRSIRTLGLAVAVAILTATGASAQERGKPAPKDQTGLEVGAKAPAFNLKDQNGKDRSLDDLLKSGTVALVFYRSADW